MSSTRPAVRRLAAVSAAVLALGVAGALAATPALADEPLPPPPPLTFNPSALGGVQLDPRFQLAEPEYQDPPPPPPAGSSDGPSPNCAVDVTDPRTEGELIKASISANCPQLMEEISFGIHVHTMDMETGRVSEWNDSGQFTNSFSFPSTRSASFDLVADQYYADASCQHEYYRIGWNVDFYWNGRTHWTQWDVTDWLPMPCGPDEAAPAAAPAEPAEEESSDSGDSEDAPPPAGDLPGGLNGLDGPRAN